MHWVQKRSLPIPALTIADPALLVAYRYWSNRRDGDSLPARCKIDTPAFRLLVPDAIWLADGAYCGRLAPYGPARGKDATLDQVLEHDLNAALQTCMPMVQLIEVKVQSCPVLYQQLLLPTADDGVNANELLEVCKLGALRLVRPEARAA